MIINKVNWPEFFAQYTSGLALSKLCQHWHVHHATAKRKMRKAGVAIRTQGESRRVASLQVRLTKEHPVAEIAAAYRAGVPVRQLCRDFHLHHRDVKRLLKQAGVEYRNLSAARKLVMGRSHGADLQARLQPMRQGWNRWRQAIKNPPVRAGF